MWWGFPVLLLLVLVPWRAWAYLYDTQFSWRGLTLILAVLGLWITVLLVDGWLWAGVAVLGSLVVNAILDLVLPVPLGRLLRGRAEGWREQERRRVAALLEQESSAAFYVQMEAEHLGGAQRCQQTLLMASIDPDVQKALTRHEKHTEDLATFHFDKTWKDLPPWHRDRAVRNPRAIDYYFGTAVDLPTSKPSRVLRVWIMERPAGEMPPHLRVAREAEEQLATERRAARASGDAGADTLAGKW